jgi:hypothetical protein
MPSSTASSKRPNNTLPISQAISQPISQPTLQPTSQSIGRSIAQSTPGLIPRQVVQQILQRHAVITDPGPRAIIHIRRALPPLRAADVKQQVLQLHAPGEDWAEGARRAAVQGVSSAGESAVHDLGAILHRTERVLAHECDENGGLQALSAGDGGGASCSGADAHGNGRVGGAAHPRAERRDPGFSRAHRAQGPAQAPCEPTLQGSAGRGA